MALKASTGTSGAPFAKMTRLGDKLVGAFASDPSKSRRRRRDYDTNEPMTKPDGSPLLEEIMHFIAMPGTTAQTGNAEAGDLEPIEPGTHIRYPVWGYKWGQVIDARKTLAAASGFRAGEEASGDVYTIELVGWSAETKNAKAATEAGFTVVDGRIVLKSQDEKDQYVLAQSRTGGNTNPAKDFIVECRRPTSEEKRWEQAADELYLSKPWDDETPVELAEPHDAGEPFPENVEPVF